MSIGLPFELSCNICKSKIEAQMCLRKSNIQVKQNQYYSSDCWKYYQLWQSKFGEANCTFATVQKYVCIINYLNIKQDVIINYELAEKKW